MRTLRRLGRLLPVLLLAAALAAPAPAHAAQVHGPRVCTGQSGQQPDPIAGDGTNKTSWCVKVTRQDGDLYHVTVDGHYYQRVNGVWTGTTYRPQKLGVGHMRLWIDSPDNPGPLPVFSAGSLYSNGSDVYSCWDYNIGGHRANCVADDVYAITFISWNSDYAGLGDFDQWSNRTYIDIFWYDKNNVRRPATGYVRISIASPWWR